MTTDNRTNEPTPDPTAERVIYEVLRQAVAASGETLEQWTGAVASELRAHNLLSEGAPTEAHVEVAAVASINSHRSRAGLPTLATLDGVPNADEWRDDARAALVAAQGAAPQAENEELAWYKRAAKHSADSMAEARDTLQQLADRVDPFVFDELSSVLDDQPLDYETGWAIGEAAPVLPSSGVDEAFERAKLTIEGVHQVHGVECLCGFKSNRSRSRTEHITHALKAEWMKEQGGEGQ